jgi:replication-associated recombination protein RarA
VFEFDKMFECSTPQSEIFQEVKPLVDLVLNGFNAAIIAYGQTGGGKTYTMQVKKKKKKFLKIKLR